MSIIESNKINKYVNILKNYFYENSNNLKYNHISAIIFGNSLFHINVNNDNRSKFDKVIMFPHAELLSIRSLNKKKRKYCVL